MRSQAKMSSNFLPYGKDIGALQATGDAQRRCMPGPSPTLSSPSTWRTHSTTALQDPPSSSWYQTLSAVWWELHPCEWGPEIHGSGVFNRLPNSQWALNSLSSGGEMWHLFEGKCWILDRRNHVDGGIMLYSLDHRCTGVLFKKCFSWVTVDTDNLGNCLVSCSKDLSPAQMPRP